MFYAIFFAKSLICIVIIPWLFFCDCFYLRNVPHLASRGTVPVSNFQQLPDRKKPLQLTLCWKLAGGNLSSSPSSLRQLQFIIKIQTQLLKKDQTIRIRIYEPSPLVEVYIITESELPLIITFLRWLSLERICNATSVLICIRIPSFMTRNVWVGAPISFIILNAGMNVSACVGRCC